MQEEAEAAKEQQDLLNTLGRTEGPTQSLRDLEFELEHNLGKTITKDDIIKLDEVD